MLQIDTYPPQPLIRSKLWFANFCVIHLVLWTIVPIFLLGTTPQNLFENIIGNNSWLLVFAPELSAITGWPFYLLSQIVIVISFWSIWCIARRFLPPLYALISVMLLEGIMYYTGINSTFNSSTLVITVWALLIFTSYAALRDQKFWQWLIVGVLVAANVYIVTQASTLFLPLLIVLLITVEGRASFKKPGIYCGAVLCAALTWPYLQLALQHHFQELNSILAHTVENDNSTTITQKFLSHIISPLHLILHQIIAMIGLFIMLLPFYYCRRIALHINNFDKQFLYIVGLGPIALTVLYAIITGEHIPATWCAPYFSLCGILALIILQPEISKRQFKWFLILFITFLILTPAIQYGRLAISQSIILKPNIASLPPQTRITT